MEMQPCGVGITNVALPLERSLSYLVHTISIHGRTLEPGPLARAPWNISTSPLPTISSFNPRPCSPIYQLVVYNSSLYSITTFI